MEGRVEVGGGDVAGKEEPQEESQEIRARHCKSDPNRGHGRVEQRLGGLKTNTILDTSLC